MRIALVSALALALSLPAVASPVPGWSWLREDENGWRQTDDGSLELRAQKGRIWAGTGATNLLLSDTKAGGHSASVAVTHHAPKTKYEQGGLLIYRDDDHFVKLINEFIDGEYFVVLAWEVGGKGRVLSKIKTGAKSLGLRLSVEGDAVTAHYAIGDGAPRPAGRCEFPGAAEAKFGLFTQDGSEKDVRWIRFAGPQVNALAGGPFETQQLTGEFHAEGAAFADLNNDGANDIIYGPFWFEGPIFEKRHVLYKPSPFPTNTYSNNFMPYAHDFDGDGWLDILVVGFPGRKESTYWLQNPGEGGGAWKRHVVFRGPGNESPAWADVDGDGKPEIVCSIDGQFGLIKPKWEAPAERWSFAPISPEGVTGGFFTHGLGLGDVDGDGRVDLLERSGWWQQREPGEHWLKHSYPFAGPGGAQMFAYDFDGDGDNDVITSLAAHGFGLAWYEQVKADDGGITFERHALMGSNPADSEYALAVPGMHGVDLADVDGDGLKDLVTGTRFFAHNGSDPGDKLDPVIYWFRTVRADGGVDFVPHLIDPKAGIGTVVNTGDVDGDGRLDVVIGNKKGCYVHLQQEGEAEPVAKVGRVVRDEMEGESLQVLAKTGNPRSQNMASFGAGVWGGDSQLWWTGGKPGDVLDLAVPVESDGFYQLSAAFTKAIDYGMFELSIDGQNLAWGALDFFQAKGVAHTGEILLGSVELKKGNSRLSVKVVGAHPDAVKGYMFGLDWIKLKKVEAKPAALFDGNSLKGWQGDPKWWRVEEGAIVGEIAAGGKLGKNQFLYWAGEVHDFDLSLKFRISGDPSANSGVQYRCQRDSDGHASGYQADLDDGAVWAGRIYDEHGRGLILERGTKVVIDESGARDVKPFREAKDYAALVKNGEWNDYRIRAVGPRMQVWINGQPAADLTDQQIGQLDYSGLLALQLHSGPGPAKIEFKDIALTELGETPEPKLKTDPYGSRAGISPEGKNLGFETGTLEGWTMAGEVWKGSPIEGDTVTPRRPGQASIHDGKFWVGGYERTKTDLGTGTLTSAAFEVTHPWASFLIGAGPHPELRVELIDAKSGEVLFKRSGTRELENMVPVVVHVKEHLGKQVRVRVVDGRAGHWGHINYDDFRFHTAKPVDRPPRVTSNPLLKHLTPNPADEGAIDTVAGMWVPEGFKVDLIAKEPDITQPIAFTFDERGRMWVAEAHSYPRKQPDGQGKDRVVILEDTDGDGSFETKKVFAEGLNLVSGLEVGFGGIWIGAAPHLLFIPDKNRDDQPDGAPTVLLDGWGYQDTHETLNSFVWGPDGWLYGNQGVFCHSKIGKRGTPDNKRTEMRAGVWRYHPVGHEFEIFATGCSNQWGIDFDEMGNMFITHCRSAWGGGPTTYVVQNGHYWNQSNSHHAPFVSGGAPGWNPGPGKVFRNYLTASARYGHGEGGAGKPGSRALYGGHAHVGAMIYLGSNWPDEHRGKLFTHNLHGHQMNVQVNERRGSGFETVHAGKDQLYTPDPRFIGVDLKYGPDGAVYFIDWHDKQHCHNNNVEVWNRSDGRIYRMKWAETWKPAKVDLRAETIEEKIASVMSRDEWRSRTARRLLQERHPFDTTLKLLKAAMKQRSETDYPAMLRALWAMHVVSGTHMSDMFDSENEDIRAWGVRICEPPRRGLVEFAKGESSPAVRLALASKLPDLDPETRWALAEALAARAEDMADAYLPKMIWFGVAELTLADPARALRIADSTPMPALRDSIVWYLSRDADGRAEIAKRLATANAPDAERMLHLMAFALPNAGDLPPPPRWAALSQKLRRPETAASLDKLGGLFGDASVLANMRIAVTDPELSLAARKKAFEFLKSSGDTGCAEQFVALLDDAEFRTDVLPLLGRFNERAVGEAALARFPQLDTAGRNALLASLSTQPELAKVLLESIRDKRTDRSVLTSLHVRQMSNLGDNSVTALIAEIGIKMNTSTEAAKASIAKYQKLYKEAPLWSFDRNAGALVFTKLCATCHKMDGEGLNLGPDLTGSHTNGVDYFIENIVDPNAVIGETFQLNIITKSDGTVLSGMPANETDEVLTVQTLTESVQVPKSEIRTRQVLQQSMMPPALLDTISEKQTIELLKFLSTAR